MIEHSFFYQIGLGLGLGLDMESKAHFQLLKY